MCAGSVKRPIIACIALLQELPECVLEWVHKVGLDKALETNLPPNSYLNMTEPPFGGSLFLLTN